jgi:antitoxin component of MazEF toxin-antitoxin module
MKTTYKYNEVFEDLEGENGDVLLKIPPDICDAVGWKVGDTISIKVEGDALVLSKVMVPV